MSIRDCCNAFAARLKAKGRLVKVRTIDENHYLYEFYSAVACPSTATVWRVSAIYVINNAPTEPLQQIHPALIDLTYQSNVTRTVLLSSVHLSDVLAKFLNQRGVEAFTIKPDEISDEQRETWLDHFEPILFPSLTDDDLAKFEDADDIEAFEAGTLDREFLFASLFKNLETVHSAMRFLMLFDTPPHYHGVAENMITTSDNKGYFSIIRSNSQGSTGIFLYPDTPYLRILADDSRTNLKRLKESLVPPDLSLPSDAISKLLKTLIHWSLLLLYGDSLDAIALELRETFLAVARQDSVLLLLLDDFENQSIDAQIALINIAVSLNFESEHTSKAIALGAQSQARDLALRCISVIGNFGMIEHVPLLEELSQDHKGAVRRKAQETLQKLTSPSMPSKMRPLMTESEGHTKVSNLIDIDPEHETVIQFSEAACHSFYHGPKDTSIHLSLFDLDSDQCIATTTHADGTRDVAMGNRNGMFFYIAGRLTGEIPPSPDDVKMGEAVIMDGDGKITERFDLGRRDGDDGQS
jgi:hypothetical protein